MTADFDRLWERAENNDRLFPGTACVIVGPAMILALRDHIEALRQAGQKLADAIADYAGPKARWNFHDVSALLAALDRWEKLQEGTQ